VGTIIRRGTYSKLISLTYCNDDVSLCCDETGKPMSIDLRVTIEEYQSLNTIRNFGG
jgi:hypothetical protein